MVDENPSMLSHVSLGSNDLKRALQFYDDVLACLGCTRIMEHGGAVAYGKVYPEFWIQTPHDGGTASVGNGTHVGFMAASREMVDDFYRAAMAAGGTDNGVPGPRAEYGEPYYGCFVLDPDGNRIEAAFWDFELDL